MLGHSRHLHLEVGIAIPQEPLTIGPCPEKPSPPGSLVTASAAQLPVGSPSRLRVVGHMALQLMLRDAGRLCFPIHVSPSPGYTVAFKWQQGTSDWDGNVKLEACGMLETPT